MNLYTMKTEELLHMQYKAAMKSKRCMICVVDKKP